MKGFNHEVTFNPRISYVTFNVFPDLTEFRVICVRGRRHLSHQHTGVRYTLTNIVTNN